MVSGGVTSGTGRVIGLLGGSFDPPHQGHVNITLAAIKRFALDEVWWLVSPGNPIKEQGPAPFEKRMAAAQALMQHPRVKVSDFEARVGTRYTSETLAALIKAFPQHRFVWLMGADNLHQFHRWQDWRGIMDTVPVGVLARPRSRISARNSVAARAYRDARLPGHASRLLGQAKAPCWCFVNVPMMGVSSTAIRAKGDWSR